MQLVSDSATDMPPELLAELQVHTVPMPLTLDGNTYRSGVDLQSVDFYKLLEKTDGFPTTSQPSAGDFAALYRELAQTDPDILSVHISSGLSGTLSAARTGASMVPEANVVFFDTMTLSCPEGWMVQMAAYAIRAGWSIDRILAQLSLMRERTQGLFTLGTLKYLIHGGRISHIKGLLASMLNVKPVIGPEKDHGTYANYGMEITWKRALNRMTEFAATMFPEGQEVRIQLLHGQNFEAVDLLRQAVSRKFKCQFDPVAVVSPILGAHTGASVVGFAIGDPEVFAGLF